MGVGATCHDDPRANESSPYARLGSTSAAIGARIRLRSVGSCRDERGWSGLSPTSGLGSHRDLGKDARIIGSTLRVHGCLGEHMEYLGRGPPREPLPRGVAPRSRGTMRTHARHPRVAGRVRPRHVVDPLAHPRPRTDQAVRRVHRRGRRRLRCGARRIVRLPRAEWRRQDVHDADDRLRLADHGRHAADHGHGPGHGRPADPRAPGRRARSRTRWTRN